MTTFRFRCVGQYMIGYLAGQSVKVQQMVGVDQAQRFIFSNDRQTCWTCCGCLQVAKIPCFCRACHLGPYQLWSHVRVQQPVGTRATEKILKQPGLSLGKAWDDLTTISRGIYRYKDVDFIGGFSILVNLSNNPNLDLGSMFVAGVHPCGRQAADSGSLNWSISPVFCHDSSLTAWQVQIFPPVCCVSWLQDVAIAHVLSNRGFFPRFYGFFPPQTQTTQLSSRTNVLRWNLKIANSTNALGHNSGHLSLGLSEFLVLQKHWKPWVTLHQTDRNPKVSIIPQVLVGALLTSPRLERRDMGVTC